MIEKGKKASSFKKFTDIDKESKAAKIPDESLDSIFVSDEFVNKPNLPSDKKKEPVLADTKHLMPKSTDALNENDVKFYGKLAKLPKGTKASKGFNFLENVKIAKNSIWYIMVEKCDNELQMVKYNYKKGVDLSKFVSDLKTYYTKQFSKNKNILKMIESIEIDGNDKYSCIKNIPLIEINGKKMISKITEDLIKLLSK